jgi:hypothetical protein
VHARAQAIEHVEAAAQQKLLHKFKLPGITYKGFGGEQG